MTSRKAMSADPEPITEALLAERGYLRLIDATMVPPRAADEYAYAERVGDRMLAVVAIDEPHTIRTVPGSELEDVGAARARQLGYVNLVKDRAYTLEEIVHHTDAAIYLLDEWDANLDPSNRAMADALVQQLSHRARVVEVSHRDPG